VTSVFVLFSAARTTMESGERNGSLPVRGDREVDDCDGTNVVLPTSTTAAGEQVGGGACPWLARVRACTPTLATRHVVRVC
jgi:hypothetical protein